MENIKFRLVFARYGDMKIMLCLLKGRPTFLHTTCGTGIITVPGRFGAGLGATVWRTFTRLLQLTWWGGGTGIRLFGARLLVVHSGWFSAILTVALKIRFYLKQRRRGQLGLPCHSSGRFGIAVEPHLLNSGDRFGNTVSQPCHSSDKFGIAFDLHLLHSGDRFGNAV